MSNYQGGEITRGLPIAMEIKEEKKVFKPTSQ